MRKHVPGIWIAARLGKRNVRDGEEVADRIGKQGTTGTAGREGEEGTRRAINWTGRVRFTNVPWKNTVMRSRSQPGLGEYTWNSGLFACSQELW
jgi:hypothetical protein